MKPTIDMTVSPYDRSPPQSEGALVQLHYRPKRWLPSRFNARTVGDDGRLILWNSFSGAISVFRPEDRGAVVDLLTREGVSAPLNRIGEYLSKRGFLVSAGSSEMDAFRYQYGQQHWRNDVLQLILMASEDCNFRCVYCYEKFKHGTMRPEVRQGVQALVLQRAPKLKSLGISWFGGEPLYGWEAIEDLGPFLKKTVDRHGIDYHQHMTTNAYLLTEDRATKLLEWGCADYQITIDGLPEEHDCKRVGRDGSPTYHVILDNLRSLKSRKDQFLVRLRVNFDRDNFPRLGAFLEALSEDFAGDNRFKMRFRAIGKWGGDSDDALDTCGVGEVRDVLRELREKTGTVGLDQEGGIRGTKLGSQVCYAARPFNFLVGATGKLMKCTVALDDVKENVVGQLYSDGRMDLNAEYMSKWVTPHFESDPLCQNCYVLPSCQGAACPLTRITDNKRTCCGVKSSLKREMRYTLEEARRTREQAIATAG